MAKAKAMTIDDDGGGFLLLNCCCCRLTYCCRMVNMLICNLREKFHTQNYSKTKTRCCSYQSQVKKIIRKRKEHTTMTIKTRSPTVERGLKKKEIQIENPFKLNENSFKNKIISLFVCFSCKIYTFSGVSFGFFATTGIQLATWEFFSILIFCRVRNVTVTHQFTFVQKKKLICLSFLVWWVVAFEDFLKKEMKDYTNLRRIQNGIVQIKENKISVMANSNFRFFFFDMKNKIKRHSMDGLFFSFRCC